MSLIGPLPAIVIALAFLIVLIYKRVNLGIVLTATALLLALIAIDWQQIPGVIYATTDPQTLDGVLAISVTIATFVIMLLSSLYKETGMINRLSESVSKIINNPKAVLSVLPAIIGLLPVAGGALMSAPLVDAEAEKLQMKHDRKAFVNLWFRHTVFPVYPISQPLIVTAGLTGVVIPMIIMRQIPVVIIMIIVGFIIGFWRVSNVGKTEEPEKKSLKHFRNFFTAFSPVLAAIVAAVTLDIVGTGYQLSKQGFDVLFATIIGVIVLIAVSRVNLRTFVKPFRTSGIYAITLAAYAAFLLREVMVKAGISSIFGPLVTNGSIDIVVLLIAAPAIFGLLTGSPQGGIAIAISILGGLVAFTPKVAALIYISAYLGYTIAPTHLCLTFTAEYFKCSLGKMYRYVIPSFVITFAVALLIYFLF